MTGAALPSEFKQRLVMQREKHRQILQEIRSLHRRGEPLNIHAVKRLHPDLLSRVYSVRPFWGWAQAIAAAGLDYRRIRIELLETVTCQVCGKELKSLTTHLPLHEVSTEEYRSSFPGEYLHSEALRAKRSDSLLARDPLLEHWEPLWSHEYILDRIHELFRRGIPLNDRYLHASDRAFEAVATKYFGSWDDALRKAGLNPKIIRRQAPRIVYHRKDVIRELRKRFRSGQPMNHAAVQFGDLRLYNALRKHFGSYSAALAASGIDPMKVRLTRQPYSKADRKCLLDAVRKTASIPEGGRRAAANHSLRTKYEKMVKRLFRSSWTLAATTAGVSYRAIHPRDHRDLGDREKVIRALKSRLKSSESLVSSVLRDDDRRLHEAVRRYFPNYYDCYAVLGLDDSEVPGRRRYATADAVVAGLRQRCEMGVGLRVVDLVFGPKRTRDNPLLSSAIHFFGGWSAALNSADIPLEKKRPKNGPSVRTILRRMREKRCHRARKP